MDVCGVDGVPVGPSRSGRLIHLDELPRGTDPEHEITAIPRSTWYERQDAKFDLRSLAEEMVTHHGTLHPVSDCDWAQRLLAALRSA